MASGQNRALVLVREAFFLILALALSATVLHATRVRPINLEEMTTLADRIVSGRVVEVRGMKDPELGRDVTLVTLEVDRAVKGRADRILTFKQIGSLEAATVRGVRITGLPRYRSGEEVILFLAGTTASGLTAPLGLGQGKFVIHEDQNGRRTAVNEFGNTSLLEGLSPGASQRLGGTAREWRGRRGIPPETLLNMAESLGRQPHRP